MNSLRAWAFQAFKKHLKFLTGKDRNMEETNSSQIYCEWSLCRMSTIPLWRAFFISSILLVNLDLCLRCLCWPDLNLPRVMEPLKHVQDLGVETGIKEYIFNQKPRYWFMQPDWKEELPWVGSILSILKTLDGPFQKGLFTSWIDEDLDRRISLTSLPIVPTPKGTFCIHGTSVSNFSILLFRELWTKPLIIQVCKNKKSTLTCRYQAIISSYK